MFLQHDSIGTGHQQNGVVIERLDMAKLPCAVSQIDEDSDMSLAQVVQIGGLQLGVGGPAHRESFVPGKKGGSPV